MAYELTREERYHKRAEELRAIADGISDEKAKKAMLDAAAAFDQLVESAKQSRPLNSLGHS
jgi:hypothetical protein